jgi:hypothetical protein
LNIATFDDAALVFYSPGPIETYDEREESQSKRKTKQAKDKSTLKRTLDLTQRPKIFEVSLPI